MLSTCRNGSVKCRRTRQEQKTRLPYYGNTVEKKDKMTTLHPLHIIVQCNGCRVVFIFLFHHVSQWGKSTCVSSLPCSFTFDRFIPTRTSFLPNLFYLYCTQVFVIIHKTMDQVLFEGEQVVPELIFIVYCLCLLFIQTCR